MKSFFTKLFVLKVKRQKEAWPDIQHSLAHSLKPGPDRVRIGVWVRVSMLWVRVVMDSSRVRVSSGLQLAESRP